MTSKVRTFYPPRTARKPFIRAISAPGDTVRRSQHGPEPAPPLYQVISDRLLTAITPVTIELALAALTSLEKKDYEIGALWRLRIERARYEVDLAERRYESVDPSNSFDSSDT